jgi:Winged helix-turn-helix DNA-binding
MSSKGTNTSQKGTNASPKSPRSERSDIGVLRLNERDKELLLLLFDNQAMSRGQIEARFFGSTPRCNSRLKKLLDAGYIVRHTATDLPGMSLQGLQAIYTPGKASFPLITTAKDLPLSEVRKLCRSDCTPLYLTHALHAAHFRQLVEWGLTREDASSAWQL